MLTCEMPTPQIDPNYSDCEVLITGKNTQFPHAYFVCKIENPHLFSFHVWLLYGKLLDKILQFSLPYKKQTWKFHFPILTWKITFPQINFYFPSMYFCSLKKTFNIHICILYVK